MSEKEAYQKSERDPLKSLAEDSRSKLKAYSFKTWYRIYPRGFNFMLWFLLGFVGALLALFDFLLAEEEPWLVYPGLACVAIFLIRWMIEICRKLFTYAS